MTWCECQDFSLHALSQTAILRFSREDVGGMVGESEFNMCIESGKLFQILCSLGGEHSRIPEAVSEKQTKNALEEMKGAVNLCQQCQGWGSCSLQSSEEHVFIIICHPSAEMRIFFRDFYFCCLNKIWRNYWTFFLFASKAVVSYKPLVNSYRLTHVTGIFKSFLKGPLYLTDS